MPYQGETVPIENTLTDYDGTPLTPDSQNVKWYDDVENGTLQYTDNAPTLIETGKYRSKYTLPTDAKLGKWKVVWTAVKGGDTDLGIFTFDVIKP